MKQNNLFTESVEEERGHLAHLDDLGDVVVRADARRMVVAASAGGGARPTLNDDGVAGNDVARRKKRFALVVGCLFGRLDRPEIVSNTSF